MGRLLLWLAVDGTERLGESTGVQIVDRRLSLTLLKTITENEGLMSVVGALLHTYDFQIGLLLVGLLKVEALLVPVLYTRKKEHNVG